MSDPFGCGPFLPDPDLVVALADFITEVEPVTDMVLAMAVLRKLYDLGIELPTAHFDGSGADLDGRLQDPSADHPDGLVIGVSGPEPPDE